MLEERRDNIRAIIKCPMSASFLETHIEGVTRNISSGGILAEITEGDTEAITEGQLGLMNVDYHGREVEFECQVLRIASRAIAVSFVEPQFEQIMLIKRIIEENS